MKQAELPDFAVMFIAHRYPLPQPVATLVARLVKLGEALS